MLALVAGVGCAGPAVAPKDEVAPAVAESPLSGLFKRESTDLPLSTFTSADGVLQGSTLARAVKVAEFNDPAYPLELDIGAGTAMQCVVITKDIDLGADLERFHDLSWAAIHTAHGGVEAFEAGLDAAVEKGTSYLYLSQVYRTASKKAGQLKTLIAALPSRGVYCVHDEPGYGETFRQAALGIATSIPSVGAPPRLRSVQRIGVNGRTIGLIRQTVVERDDGQLVAVEHASAVGLNDKGAVRAIEQVWVDLSTPEGGLLEARRVFLVGDTKEDFLLKRGDGDVWVITQPDKAGEPVSTGHSEDLLSTIGRQRESRRMCQGEAEPTSTFLVFSPSMVPNALLPAGKTLKTGGAACLIDEWVQERHSLDRVDALGTVKSTFKDQKGEWLIERLFAEGTW